jgi:hypothetical protein
VPHKVNCWEEKKCERQPGGALEKELGVCPVAICDDYAGVHDGEKAGRACWVVAETLCGGAKQGSFADKYYQCKACSFFKMVQQDEESSMFGFAQTPMGISIYKKNKAKLKAG